LKIGEGAFVWTHFPFGPPYRPDRPGPMPHVAYCVGVQQGSGSLEIVLAYTSSGRWRGGSGRVPPGVIEFDAATAARLKQRSFHLDLRVLARVPPTLEWFPHRPAPDQGILAWADPALRDRIARELTLLARRSPEVIPVRGIGVRP